MAKMKPGTICDRLGDIGEDVCQLQTGVGETSDGLAARLADLQGTISTLKQDVARQVDGG